MRASWLTALSPIVLCLALPGCANNHWGACETGMTIAGALVGGAAGGTLVSEYEKGSTSDAQKAAGAGGGLASGALVGALLSQAVCGTHEDQGMGRADAATRAENAANRAEDAARRAEAGASRVEAAANRAEEASDRATGQFQRGLRK